MLTYIPSNVVNSTEAVIGDIEKFMELFESGFYEMHHDTIIERHKMLAEKYGEQDETPPACDLPGVAGYLLPDNQQP